jgi:outer membrane protein assembly factor BamE (lipoprotein component of BamABCDE complex)
MNARSVTALGAGTLLALSLLFGCDQNPPGHRLDARVWTESELRSLQGKTRDEIQATLGKPTGLLTYDEKNRWHYPNLLVKFPDGREPRRMSALIYFSQFGEHRSTIIDITDRLE